MAAEPHRSVALAITGASGALYAVRTLAELLSRGLHVELVVSDYGRRLLRDELGEEAAVERLMPYLSAKYGSRVGAGSFTLLQQSRSRRDDRQRQPGLHGDGDRAVLDEDAGRHRPRPVAQPRRARGRRDAEGAAPPGHRAARNADEPARSCGTWCCAPRPAR